MYVALSHERSIRSSYSQRPYECQHAPAEPQQVLTGPAAVGRSEPRSVTRDTAAELPSRGTSGSESCPVSRWVRWAGYTARPGLYRTRVLGTSCWQCVPTTADVHAATHLPPPARGHFHCPAATRRRLFTAGHHRVACRTRPRAVQTAPRDERACPAGLAPPRCGRSSRVAQLISG